ncbi:MAG: hypothetical protein ABIF12_00065 [bacterium]
MLIEGFDFLYIAFQLTLFFLLSIIVYKLLKDYLIPYLYSEIESIKKKQTELKDKKNLLLASEKKIKEEIMEQKYSFNLLENNVKSWKDSLIEQNNKSEILYKELFNKIKEKRELQSNNLSLLKAQKIVIPEAIKRSYRDIKNLYGGEKSRWLLNELIEKIKPGS